MKVKTETEKPDVKLITAESVDDAVFETPSPGGELHSSLECRALNGVDLVFGRTDEMYDATCDYCS